MKSGKIWKGSVFLFLLYAFSYSSYRYLYSSEEVDTINGKPELNKVCQVGENTKLAASSCVNVWSAKEPRFRWPDLKATCDPKIPNCDSENNGPPKTLRISECQSIHIVEMIPEDHIAKVSCVNGVIDPNEQFYVNLDSLVCNSITAHRYTRLKPSLVSNSNVIGENIIKKASMRMRDVQNEVDYDTKLLISLAKKTQSRALYDQIRSAYEEIDDLLTRVTTKLKFDRVCEPLDEHRILSGNEIRAQRTCRILRTTDVVGKKLLSSARNSAKLMKDKKQRIFQESDTMKRTMTDYEEFNSSYSKYEALSKRMLLFYALRDKYPGLENQLKLIRKSVETGVEDPGHPERKFFWELHSGFVFGGRRLVDNSGGGYDCSDFVASLLTGHEQEVEEVSTKALKTVARHLDGEATEKDLSKGLRALASCFTSVNLRKGERPQSGDFVISNSETFDNGHVALVKEVFPNKTISTIEASGTANAVISKVRPLFEPSPKCEEEEPQLPMRSDLYILRVKPIRPKECPLVIPMG